MAQVEMHMPKMGESINEATITTWLKQPGDAVKKDEILLEISTDKVDSEVPSPATGVLAEIRRQVDEVVPVGEVIAIIETEAGVAVAPPTGDGDPKVKPSPAPAAEIPPAKPSPATPQPAPASAPPTGGKRFYSPLVRAISREEGVSPGELATLPGTGLGGRVSKHDILQYLQTRGAATPAPQASPATQTVATGELGFDPFQPYPVHADPSRMEVQKLSPMRRGIAEHMVRSVHTSPHVHVVAQVDVTEIVRFRERAKAAFAAREGVKLTFTPFLSWAVIQALREHPILNASMDWASKQVLVHKDIHLGMATAVGDAGLLVPVVRNAEERSFVGLARVQADLAARARGKQLSPDETQGATFSITNNGQFGILAGFPIINQPAVAILAAGTIQKTPVVLPPDDAIAVRSILHLTLTFDHRVVDGAQGGHGLVAIVNHLEHFDFEAVGLGAYGG